jgi:hypothetical protein
MPFWKVDSDDPEALVTVAEFSRPADLMLARARLESAGLECFAADENMNRLAGMLHGGIMGPHGVRLQVRRADLEDALALLNSPADDISFPDDDRP